MATMDKELAEEHVRDLEERLAVLTEQNNRKPNSLTILLLSLGCHLPAYLV